MDKPQYIVDEKGKKVSVVLSLKQYQHLLEQLDDAYCQKLFDKAVEANEPVIPLNDYLKRKKATSFDA